MSAIELDSTNVSPSTSGRSYLRGVRRRISGGDLGALPVIVGLIIIWTIFQTQQSSFLTARNMTNLVLQIASIGTISVGIVLVLILGEIDLSIGSVSGLTSALMAVLIVKHGWNPILAVIIALLAGMATGLINGFFFTRFGVPTFVVTLAGLIGWQGMQLEVLGDTGTVNLPDGFITKLTTTYLPTYVGWIVSIALLAIYIGSQLLDAVHRRRAGLRPRSVIDLAVRSVVAAACLLVATAVLNHDRGVPVAMIIFFGFVVVFDLLLRHTTFGRSIFAIGGNAEAARRAGINVSMVRIAVFMLSGFMAAAGGILAASRLFAVGQSAGGGDVLLDAIAAAVIGGTSLFGGRGTAYSALLGMLVIGSVSNGIDLIGLGAPIKLMITGGVLLAAVTIDALSRRGRQSSGRA
jgi:D-xylose transport system permease protein